MPGGFLQGLLGGLAGGFADATWEKHQQEIQRDLASKKFLIEAIKGMTERPDFRPEMLPVAFQHIQQLFEAKPGTKGGKKQQGGAMQSFIEQMSSHPFPGTGQGPEVPAMPAQMAPDVPGLPAVPGGPASGIPPVPMTASGFKTMGEMGQEAFNAQKPILDWRMNKQQEQQAYMLEKQRENQNAIAQRQQFNIELRSKLKNEGDVGKLAAAYKFADPDLTDVEANAKAAQDVLDAQGDKQRAYEDKHRYTEALIRVGDSKLKIAQDLAESLIQNRKFQQEAAPWKAIISTAHKDLSDAADAVRRLIDQRTGYIFAANNEQDATKKANLVEQIRVLGTEIEAKQKAHEAAVAKVQEAINNINAIGGNRAALPTGGTEMAPLPSAQPKTKSISTIQYQKMVTDLGKDVADATLKRRGVIVRD